jgi:hypothetical protein
MTPQHGRAESTHGDVNAFKRELVMRAGDPTAGSRLRVNSHVHVPPNFSAFSTVDEMIDLAVAQGVEVVGTSNYYDFEVYRRFGELAAGAGIFPLYGLEVVCLVDELAESGTKINDPGNPGKMYLCGKGISRFAPMAPEADALMSTIRDIDSARIVEMIDKLAGLFASAGVPVEVSEDSVKAAVVRRHSLASGPVYLQERHVAQAFQEALFACVPTPALAEALATICHTGPGAALDAVSVQNALRSHLMKAGKPGYVPERFVDFDHAYRLILALGGMPCYPVLADGATPMCPFEESAGQLVSSLRERRIPCAELIPNRNAPEVLAEYASALHEAGLVVLAGTEHNTLDVVAMEPHCAGGVPIPDPVKDIFWEGACVVAAHQDLTARGQAGYVDESGAPNPAYAGPGGRKAFAALGAAVIEEYRRVTPGPDKSLR